MLNPRRLLLLCEPYLYRVILAFFEQDPENFISWLLSLSLKLTGGESIPLVVDFFLLGTLRLSLTLEFTFIVSLLVLLVHLLFLVDK